MPTNPNPDSESNTADDSTAKISRREQLAARLAKLSPEQREQLRQKMTRQRSAAISSEAPKSASAATTQNRDLVYGENAIAIVGMGCRLPGAANPQQFWDLISSAAVAVGPVPSDRWDQSTFYDPTGRAPGKMSVNALGSLDNIDEFDPAFFGIAPREASRMDPQQRLLLEVVWETFEDAGIPVDSMCGSNTGVFVGIGGTDYSKVPSRYPNYFEQVDAHIGTGNALSIAAGRISYLFDFQGPAFIVDTACSSGLVAMHSAAVSLLRGESDCAVAGAVNLILSPETTIAFSKARMLSPDGQCRPFDGAANGYVRGEGCALVLMKRLSDAQRDGDRILGVLRGSAVNQDGRTSGITAPSGSAQQRVIRTAMKTAGVNENDPTYIEAHGTGTPLGDPIELMALSETFGRRATTNAPIRVGSVKANIGHTETVSGMAGLLKVLLMFDREQIPAQANFDTLNPNVKLPPRTLQIASESHRWNANDDGRFIAGVSSFGFGGTNAHVIVEKPIVESSSVKEADKNARDPSSSVTVPPPVFCLPYSARSEDALEAVASQLMDAAEGIGNESLHDLCGTFATRRDSHAIRSVAIGESCAALRDSLISKGIAGRRRAGSRTRLAMVFTGQGSQYTKMGMQLAETLPAFESSLRSCAAVLDPLLPLSLRELLAGGEVAVSGETRNMDHTSLAQPAICAIQCCLVDTYRAIGIRPDVVAGHSIGEIAALYAAGAFSREQALSIAAYRGQVMGELPPGGAMAALLTGHDVVGELLESIGSSAVVATMNGPSSTVVAGTCAEVDAVCEAASQSGIAVRPLVVSHAFHSPLMQSAAGPLRERIAELVDSVVVPRNVTFISGLTGEVCQAVDTEYWIRHLLQPVRFTEVIEKLGKQNLDLAIEVGPRPQLCGMIRRATKVDASAPIRTVSSLDAKKTDYDSWLQSIATAWCVGGKVDWKAVHEGYSFQRIDLPTYPFQRQRYWYDPPTIGRSGGSGDRVHPLLGTAQSLASGETVYSNVIRDTDPSYLADHVVSGSVTVPAAAWMEALRAAGNLAFSSETIELLDVQISRALFLQPGEPVAIQTQVGVIVGGRCQVQISYRTEAADSKWQPCASAVIKNGGDFPLPEIALVPKEAIDVDELYSAMAESGLAYGSLFQTMHSVKSDGNSASAGLSLAKELALENDSCQWHPALLDGALQLIATVVPVAENGKTFLPVGVDQICVASDVGGIASAQVKRVTPANSREELSELVADVELFDVDHRLVAKLSGVRLKSLQREQASRSVDPADWIYRVEWLPAALEVDASAPTVSVNHVGGKRLVKSLNWKDGATPTSHWLWTSPKPLSDHNTSSDCDTSARVFAATCDLVSVIQSAADQTPCPMLSIVTSCASQVFEADSIDPVAAAIVGLARTATNEYPQLKIQVLDVQDLESEEQNGVEITTWLQRKQSETELALRAGRFFQPRLHAAPRRLSANDPEAELGIPDFGCYRVRLDGTNRTEGLWTQRIASPSVYHGEVAIKVSAVGLNFSDVLKSMGLYPGIQDKVVPLGIEVCGRLTKLGDGAQAAPIGTRVMGVVPHGFASDDATNDYLVTPVPSNLSDEEAAALPIAFLTAQHALVHVGRLQKGESVLIHAGAGGVGLAAIQVAQAIGATIFTTAGHPTKRTLLCAMGIDNANIFSSRDVSSIQGIRQRTGGQGVDVVLNSLPGEWIDASLDQLSAHGRFLEIGKIDIYQNRALGLLPFQDNLTYSAIDLDRLLRERPDHVRRLYSEITQALSEGVYQPLPITSFRLEELSNAMRFMAARKNIGKIVVSPPLGKPDPIAAKGVHLITGGSGSIALGAARRLIGRGAVAVALVARSTANDQVSDLIRWSAEQGATCLYVQADCTDVAQMQKVVADVSKKHAPIVGVVHTAGTLQDSLIHDMDRESLERVLGPKVEGTIAVETATKDQPLQYFTLLGSIASVFGSPGQANYAAANAFLEGFAARRRGSGRPANVVHWGPWASNRLGSGGMADDAIRQRNLAARGLHGLDFDNAIDLLLDAANHCGGTDAVVVDADWNRMLAAGTLESLPSVLRSMKGSAENTSVGSSTGVDEELRAKLNEMKGSDRCLALQAYFADQIGRIMSLDGTSIDPEQPLGSLGLDSLMAIELKNTVETRLDIAIPISAFMDEPTLRSLSETAVTVLSESDIVSDGDS